MNFLVVGGAGYIGSVVCEELVRARHSVIVLDDLSTGHRDAVPALAYLIEGRIGDEAALKEALTIKSLDAVIHLAGKSIVGESVKFPEAYHEANVVDGIRLLDAMQTHDVRTIVYSSTAAVYDPTAAMPLREESALRPGNPYGNTKLAFERILSERAGRGSISHVTFRYFNVAGASIDHGEDHRDETHLIPLLLDAARGARGPVPVYGTDYPTPDGTAVRDYVHVLDLAEAHVRAAKYLAGGGEPLTLNLGSERGASVREVAAAVKRVTGRDVPTVDSDRREGDPPVLIASSEGARRVVGWKPQFGDLDTIVETAWEWRQRFPEGYAS
ncbi:MAG TPA: UDP-glucose 4-epimerase GalE [Candidatus Eisenbacteria bacterium]|nr:UDP-glucose 4-epimerase GalE [Candidatus Eisenbacteria bacterium]